METTPKKATDVLLEIQASQTLLMQMISALEVKLNVISNKLNLMGKIVPDNQPTIEAISPFLNQEKSIPINTEVIISQEDEPNGMRRTSRPDKYSGDNAIRAKAPKPAPPPPKYPVQIPKPDGKAEIIVPAFVQPEIKPPKAKISGNTINIATSQRITDKNGKSIFLANVSILNKETMEEVVKARTSGVGKWSASLPPGSYKIIIDKRDGLTKEKIESIQEVFIEPSMKSPYELPTMIIR